MNFDKIFIVLLASFSCFTLHCQLRNGKSLSPTPTSGLSQFPNLLKACKENDTQKVESLISTCELLHSKNPEWSPLVWAVVHQNEHIVKLLLEKGSNPNIHNIDFNSISTKILGHVRDSFGEQYPFKVETRSLLALAWQCCGLLKRDNKRRRYGYKSYFPTPNTPLHIFKLLLSKGAKFPKDEEERLIERYYSRGCPDTAPLRKIMFAVLPPQEKS